jgi:hypothetical protein
VRVRGEDVLGFACVGLLHTASFFVTRPPQTTNALTDGIEITRVGAGLSTPSVVSNLPAFKGVVGQLKRLIAAKATLELYYPRSTAYTEAMRVYKDCVATLHATLAAGAVRATAPVSRVGGGASATPIASGSLFAAAASGVDAAGGSVGDAGATVAATGSTTPQRGVLNVGGVRVGFGLKLWRLNTGVPAQVWLEGISVVLARYTCFLR